MLRGVKVGRASRKPTSAMKVTTLRFGRDLWRLLESEAALVGTSVSQYIREAALARAAASAARRGESPFELLADAAHGLAAGAESQDERAEIERAVGVIERARAVREGSQALRAESRQAAGEASKRTARAAAAAKGEANDEPAGR
jgi:alkyl hydroperoxide reductase subunit AhpC